MDGSCSFLFLSPSSLHHPSKLPSLPHPPYLSFLKVKLPSFHMVSSSLHHLLHPSIILPPSPPHLSICLFIPHFSSLYHFNPSFLPFFLNSLLRPFDFPLNIPPSSSLHPSVSLYIHPSFFQPVPRLLFSCLSGMDEKTDRQEDVKKKKKGCSGALKEKMEERWREFPVACSNSQSAPQKHARLGVILRNSGSVCVCVFEGGLYPAFEFTPTLKHRETRHHI